MEIRTIIDKSSHPGDEGQWLWLKGSNYNTFRVYYVEINYKFNHTLESGISDGLNYFKYVTIKKTKNSPWQIAELSGAQAEWKDK
jgi:hypothetical protein